MILAVITLYYVEWKVGNREVRHLLYKQNAPGLVAQLVISPIADPGVVSSIPVPYFHGDGP